MTIRWAFPDDAEAIARLAALDDAALPPSPLLLAEAGGGELRAALSLADGSVIADPFHRTAGLVDLLRARAVQLRDEPPPRRKAFGRRLSSGVRHPVWR